MTPNEIKKRFKLLAATRHNLVLKSKYTSILMKTDTMNNLNNVVITVNKDVRNENFF